MRKALDTLGVSHERKGFEQIVKGVAYMLQCDDWTFPPQLKDVIAAIAKETGELPKSIAVNIERSAKDAGYWEGSRDFLMKVVRMVAREGNT